MKTLLLGLIIIMLLLATFGADASAADLRITNLRCEYRVNPLGVDAPQPRLSWVLESDTRGQKQTAYQILVASSEANLKAGRGDLWDSGRVASDRTSQIAYAGTPLRSGQRGVWKVRVWDKSGAASADSATAFWEMGLLDPGDWQAARWIGLSNAEKDAPVSLDDAVWVWFPEGEPATNAPRGNRFFRKVITLPEGAIVTRARFFLTADNAWELLVNGHSAGRGESWERIFAVDIAPHLTPGSNVLAIHASNTSDGPAGLIGALAITLENHPPRIVPIDETWKASNRVQRDWQDAAFDDAAWGAAKTVAAYGAEPWGRPSFADPMGPSPFLRRVFRVEKSVRRARLYATALGLYEPHLNGQRIGAAYFAPGWTDYTKRVQYQTYDVTKQIRTGENVVGAVLGDGWYSGYVGFGMRRNQYGSHPEFRALLALEYADGSTETIATDDSWRAATGPILQSDLQMGETFDARAALPGWDAAGFHDGAWRPVLVGDDTNISLVAEPNEPIEVTEELRPRKVMEPQPGVFVFDMGQNLVGWARLRVRGKPGDTVRLRFAEMLSPDGTIYTTNLRAARQTDTYVLKGDGIEVWEPRFTFHGFRYVEVTGWPENARPDLSALVGRVAHSATPRVGRMETSSALVNQLLQNIDWGQRGNFVSVPTDCPQRDERLGWTGDAQIFIRTATYNRDVAAFFTKWTQDLEDAQSAAGAFPDVAPRQAYVGEGTAAWGDAGTICPWTVYQVYGDARLLGEHYDSMVRWVEYLRAHSNHLLRPAAGYGDWLSIAADTPKDVLATAYFAHSTRLVARAARALNKRDDADKYEKLFEEIKAAFNKAYVSDDARIKGDTQTGYVLALQFDLLPENKRAEAARHLVADIEAKGGHLSTGFVGVGYLCPVLTETGHNDVAYRLLENTTFPSWGYSIQHGATTIWERWDGWTEEKGFQDPGMNSFNHYSLGSVGEWLFATVAGIDMAEDAPGFQRLTLFPRPGGSLTHSRATFDSIHGRIATDWTLDGAAYRLEVTVPANTTATVYVLARSKDTVREGDTPADQAEGVTFLRREGDYAVYAVESGTYRFRSERP